MILLSQATDEQINAECQSRIDRGDRSPDVYCSRQQSDEKAKLDVLRSAIVSAYVDQPRNRALGRLMKLLDTLDAIRANPLPDRPAIRLNTTRYGREDEIGGYLQVTEGSYG